MPTLPTSLWAFHIYPYLGCCNLQAVARTCHAFHRFAQPTLMRRKARTPELYAAVARLQRCFSPQRTVAIHRNGLHTTSRRFLDGDTSELTVADVLAYERLLTRRYDSWIHGEMRDWILMYYTGSDGYMNNLTVWSVLTLLFPGGMGPLRTMFGKHVHLLRFYVTDADGSIYLPSNITDAGGIKHDFLTWDYYPTYWRTNEYTLAFDDQPRLDEI